MSDLDSLFEENATKDADTSRSGVKSIADRFKSLMEILYFLNIIVIFTATLLVIGYVVGESYINNIYVVFALFAGFFFWVINEITFGLIATVIDIRDGIEKLNSKEES